MSTMALSTVFSSCSVVCCCFLLLLILPAGGGFSDQDPVNISSNSADVATNLRSRRVFLEATKAKAFIKDRQKRIWWWWEESEEEEESRAAERRREDNHRRYLARICPSNCWGVWSGWGSCSSPCGNNGIKRATRIIAPPSSCRDWVNTYGCPGNSSKSVLCNRFCNNGGTPGAGSCECKPGYYGTCCEHRKTCGFPGRPANGAVTPSSGSSYFGTVARFNCSTGYRLVGSSTRTCQTNGQWNGATPRCNIITCPNPGIPANGKTVGANFQYMKTVVFRCNTGYRLIGASSSKCLASARWSNIPPKCQVVNCPALSSPTGGSVQVRGPPVYRSVATYSCNTGYYMVGPRTRTCQASGRWDGADTHCLQTTCSDLPRPQNGEVKYSGGGPRYYGQVALFSCRSGYILKGSTRRTCGGSGSRGVWSGSQTTCIPVSCGDPGRPIGGVRVGSVFTFPSSVTFQCLPGHYMHGAAKITCLSNGGWSAVKPTCNECAMNHYKTGSSSATSCALCPAHSHTAEQGSTTIKQCVCDSGFRGNPGGPCTPIRCPKLVPPVHGYISTCLATQDGICKLVCNNGYIRSSGDGVRTCQQDGKWSGTDPVCTACPKDTYQATESKCERCSVQSHTIGVASVRNDCVCDQGYTGPAGGPCEDVNECGSGNGGCEQKCENTVGSYRCVCNIPGFKTDSTNAEKCIEYRKCPSFPTPANGGAVCNRIFVVNTRRCQVKCNYGYDHLASPKKYEECGPDTGWRWSFESAGREITSCIEQVFQGVAMEAAVFYFDGQCGSLTTAQRQELRRQFVTMLQAKGVCKFQGQQVCNIDQVRIECGDVEEFDDWLPESMRKKRSADTEQGKRVLRISFAFDVPPVAVRDVSCGRYCGKTPLDSEACSKTCKDKYMDAINSSIKQEGEKLKTLFKFNVRVREVQPGVTADHLGMFRPLSVSFPEVTSTLALSVGGRTLLPASPILQLGEAKPECKPGTIDKNGFCMPCDRGSMWNAQTKKCSSCKPDTHAPRVGMTRCLPCPPGYAAPTQGATRCVPVR